MLRRVARITVPSMQPLAPATHKRLFNVLGIETSCDDTCISVLQCDTERRQKPSIVHTEIARSLDANEQYGGIHPIVALESHKKHMNDLVTKAMEKLDKEDITLDLVSVTKGPGMKASLQVGITAAETLATDLKIPVLGVHHMQAHALTPRLLEDGQLPDFPYMTLLVSGGHTLLLKSKSVVDHEIMASTLDIAIGDCIDKIAKDLKVPWHGLMPGAALEVWCKDEEKSTSETYVPHALSPELRKKINLKVPLHAKQNIQGVRSDRMEFSFSGLGSSVSRILTSSPVHGESIYTETERRGIGAEAMSCAFKHVTEKVIAALNNLPGIEKSSMTALVVSGGVARNQWLRQIMKTELQKSGFPNLRLIFPPLDLCSDNATMIAWTAFEMWHSTQADRDSTAPASDPTPMLPRPKWPLTDLLVADDVEFNKILQTRDRKQPHLPLKPPPMKKTKVDIL